MGVRQLQCAYGRVEAGCAVELGGQGGGEGGSAPGRPHPQVAWDYTGPHPSRPRRHRHCLDLISKGL